MSNVIEFPYERTEDGRQRTIMGLSVQDFNRVSEIKLNSPKNVVFFTEEHWQARLKWERETLSGRLKRIRLKLNSLINKPTSGQLIHLQSARYRLRFKGI